MTMFKNLNKHALKSKLVLNQSLICRSAKTLHLSLVEYKPAVMIVVESFLLSVCATF